MGIEDAGVCWAPAELVSADHQNKPDIATGLPGSGTIGRCRHDHGSSGSPVGFAVQTIHCGQKPVLPSLRPAPI
jgi:hypothetical protein